MKKTFTFLLTIFSFVALAAQTTGQFAFRGGRTEADGMLNYASGSISEKKSKLNLIDNPNIQGSPYTSNSFAPTPLFYKDEKVKDIFYRYNAFNEEIEMMSMNRENETILGLLKDKDLSIRPGGLKMNFSTFVTSKKRTTNGYLTKLVEGKNIDLFKRTHIKYTAETASQNSFVKAIPARFTKFIEYYTQKKGVNRIDEILPKNSKLLKLVDTSKKEALKNYLKENSLNIKNEKEMIQAFEFLNQ